MHYLLLLTYNSRQRKEKVICITQALWMCKRRPNSLKFTTSHTQESTYPIVRPMLGYGSCACLLPCSTVLLLRGLLRRLPSGQPHFKKSQVSQMAYNDMSQALGTIYICWIGKYIGQLWGECDRFSLLSYAEASSAALPFNVKHCKLPLSSNSSGILILFDKNNVVNTNCLPHWERKGICWLPN